MSENYCETEDAKRDARIIMTHRDRLNRGAIETDFGSWWRNREKTLVRKGCISPRSPEDVGYVSPEEKKKPSGIPREPPIPRVPEKHRKVTYLGKTPYPKAPEGKPPAKTQEKPVHPEDPEKPMVESAPEPEPEPAEPSLLQKIASFFQLNKIAEFFEIEEVEVAKPPAETELPSVHPETSSVEPPESSAVQVKKPKPIEPAKIGEEGKRRRIKR